MISRLRAGIRLGPPFEAHTLDQAHVGVDDSFGCEAMGFGILKAENVADEVKSTDLTSSVGEELVAANGPRNDLVDVLRRLFLAVDLGAPPVMKFTGDEVGVWGGQPTDDARYIGRSDIDVSEHGPTLFTMILRRP